MEVSDMRGEADGDKCVQPGAENAWSIVISVYQYQRGGYGRQTQTLLSDRTRVSGHKLKYREFCLKVRNKNITFFLF